jgi:TRAP-type C4-dicarboxylate transport system permease large subunit
VLLLLGSVLEIYAAIVILAPLLAPLAPAYGIDPLHLGIVFLANLELGFLLPPMGLNLMLASTRFELPLTRLYRKTLPFLLISLAGLLLITYVPAMTHGLLDWLRAAPAAPDAAASVESPASLAPGSLE